MRARKPSRSGLVPLAGTIDFASAAMAGPSIRKTSDVTAAKEPPHARAPRAGRMTCSGRSPGSRVVTLLRLPGLGLKKPSGISKKDSPPTVAGAALDLARGERLANRTKFPLPADVTGTPKRRQLKRSDTSCQGWERLRSRAITLLRSPSVAGSAKRG